VNTTVNININKFFEDNSIIHQTPYHFSTLYLIIRDAKVCLKLNPNKIDDELFKTYGAEWPAVMTIFSGIDLLGKLYSGNDIDNVGSRFKSLIVKYFDECNTQSESEIIYSLRNALDHSFNLYSNDYNFSLIRDKNKPLISDKIINNRNYKQVNVCSLYNNLRSSCNKYHNDLLDINNYNLRNNFNIMFQKYGITFMY